MIWKLTSTLVPAVLLLFLGTAERALSELTCNVTRQSDLSFKYELNKPPDYPDCNLQWEDENKISIVANSSYAEHIVQEVTDQSVILKHCVEYLHHSRDCLEGFEEVNCTANCSLLSNEESHRVTVNSTLSCIFWSWCPDQTTVIFIGCIIVAAILAIGFVVRAVIKCKRSRIFLQEETIAYSPADQEIKIVLNDVLTSKD